MSEVLFSVLASATDQSIYMSHFNELQYSQLASKQVYNQIAFIWIYTGSKQFEFLIHVDYEVFIVYKRSNTCPFNLCVCVVMLMFQVLDHY